MKKTLILLAIGVVLFATPIMACDTNPYCVDGDQVEVHFINGSMITATFKVPIPGTYTIDIRIKNLKGVLVKRVKASGVLDCSYGTGEDGKTMWYISLKGRPLKYLTNYMFEVTESIETSPEEFEMYYLPWEGDAP